MGYGPTISWAVVGGGIGTSTCSINVSGTLTRTNNSYCSTSALATSGGYDGKYVITATNIMECT
jgi:hypothetical protein